MEWNALVVSHLESKSPSELEALYRELITDEQLLLKKDFDRAFNMILRELRRKCPGDKFHTTAFADMKILVPSNKTFSRLAQHETVFALYHALRLSELRSDSESSSPSAANFLPGTETPGILLDRYTLTPEDRVGPLRDVEAVGFYATSRNDDDETRHSGILLQDARCETMDAIRAYETKRDELLQKSEAFTPALKNIVSKYFDTHVSTDDEENDDASESDGSRERKRRKTYDRMGRDADTSEQKIDLTFVELRPAKALQTDVRKKVFVGPIDLHAMAFFAAICSPNAFRARFPTPCAPTYSNGAECNPDGTLVNPMDAVEGATIVTQHLRNHEVLSEIYEDMQVRAVALRKLLGDIANVVLRRFACTVVFEYPNNRLSQQNMSNTSIAMRYALGRCFVRRLCETREAEDGSQGEGSDDADDADESDDGSEYEDESSEADESDESDDEDVSDDDAYEDENDSDSDDDE